MFFDTGLAPIVILLIALFLLAILSDFLLEIFSIRFSLSTGRIQAWLFDRFGQNLMGDFLISIFYQFFSFRKKAYFMQISSLTNVGSFLRKQSLILTLGSFVGIGLSIFVLVGAHLWVLVGFIVLSIVLCLLIRDQIRDMAVAFVALALFLTSLYFFNDYVNSLGLNLRQYEVGAGALFALVFASTVFFRTPVAFLIFLGMLHLTLGFSLVSLPLLFFFHSLCSLGRFYFYVLKGRHRLGFSLASVIGWQLTQLVISLFAVMSFRNSLMPILSVGNFLEAYQVCVLGYFVYNSLPLLLVSPLAFIFTKLPYFDVSRRKKRESQKIIFDDKRGASFSIHISLFLLRQEFKKYATSFHTLIKLSREADHGEDEINQRFVRYQGMLIRVGEELKELCFCIGRQRSYRSQVKEVMSYYRLINQLELLVEDLSYVAKLLLEKDQDEEWERECRFWLGLQLKIFESFFDNILGMGEDDLSRRQVHIEKSYEILDRFFGEKKNRDLSRNSSKTFYRITESIGKLTVEPV